MSMGYAQKLTYREDVGSVGMSELFDPPETLERKISELASMIRKSKHLVVFTGAGISTSCGIPDFRGPKGVWTLQHEGKGIPEASLPFHRAIPSLTHMALVELERVGILKFVISQNVDSLHLRSGIPREKLSELHGNSFREICPSCGEEYLRDFEVETIGMKETSRRCSNLACGAKLKDTVLDWEDALPRSEMIAAEKQCKGADIVLCLGTSLQITPACNLPLKSIRGGGKIVIVNLQQTPKDKKASLVIHGLVDKVIAGVMEILSLRIPPYVHIDVIQLYFSHTRKKEKYAKWTLRIASVHGAKAPLPFLKSIEVSFLERPDLKIAILQKQPFCLIRETKRARSFRMILKLNFTEGSGCAFAQIDFPVNFQLSSESFSHEKHVIFQKLKATAVENASCGHTEIVEKKVNPGNNTSVHAIVTNICLHESYAVKACESNRQGNKDTKEFTPVKFGSGAPNGKNEEDMNNGNLPLEKAVLISNGSDTKRVKTADVFTETPSKRYKVILQDGHGC